MLLPNWAAGTTNLSQCRIKVVFEGYYYFVMLDDLTLEIAPSYDLAIGEPDTTASDWWKRGDFIRMGGNRYSGVWNYSMLHGAASTGWSWGAKVVNRGAQDIPPSLHPRLICRVDERNAFTGTVVQNVFSDTIVSMDTIVADDWNGIVLEKDLMLADLDFLMPSYNIYNKTYTAYYWVEHDGTDGSTWRDTVQHSFEVAYPPHWSTSHYGYVSKAEKSPNDGRVQAHWFMHLSDTTRYRSVEYGSVYYFSEHHSYHSFCSFYIDSVDWRYYVPYFYSGDSSLVLSLKIYEYNDSPTGSLSDGEIQATELSEVGMDTLRVEIKPYQQGGYQLATFIRPVDVATGQRMQVLNRNTFYYISITVEPGATGGGADFDYSGLLWSGVDLNNYAMNRAKSTSALPFSACTVGIKDTSDAWQRYFSCTRDNYVPSIGIYFSEKCYSLVSKQENTFANPLVLFPNPVTEQLLVQTTLEQPMPVEYIVTDALGRVVYHHKEPSSTAAIRHSITVEQLPAGMYTVTLQSKQGALNQQFIKQ